MRRTVVGATAVTSLQQSSAILDNCRAMRKAHRIPKGRDLGGRLGGGEHEYMTFGFQPPERRLRCIEGIGLVVEKCPVQIREHDHSRGHEGFRLFVIQRA